MLSDAEWIALREKLVDNFDEDIVQDLLLDLWQKLQAGAVIRQPAEWCWVGCVRRTQNKRRDFNSHPHLSIPDGEVTSPFWWDTRTPEQAIIAKEQVELASPELLALTLFHDQEESKEILGKLRVQRIRALRKFKELVDPTVSTEEITN